MDWTPDQAWTYTKLADTTARARYWATVANRASASGHDDGSAIAVVCKALHHRLIRAAVRRGQAKKARRIITEQGRLI